MYLSKDGRKSPTWLRIFWMAIIPVTLYMETLALHCTAFPFYQEDYKKLWMKPLVLSLCAGLAPQNFLLDVIWEQILACLCLAFFLNSSLFPPLVFRDAKNVVIFLLKRPCMPSNSSFQQCLLTRWLSNFQKLHAALPSSHLHTA